MKSFALHLLLPLSLVVALGGGPAFAQVIWSIGQPDGANTEFAISGNHGSYGQEFPNDVTYMIGESKPGTDWAAIQPGPVDVWAGSKPHPYRVRFKLDEAPSGTYILKLSLAATHESQPGHMVVQVNGKPTTLELPPGPGDSALTDPKRGKPFRTNLPLVADLLREGENEIRFETTGSWVLWDCVMLVRLEGDADLAIDPDSVRFSLQPFFFDRDGKLYQRARLSLTSLQPVSDVTFRVRIGNRSHDFAVESDSWGAVVEDVEIPEITEPADAVFEIRKGNDVLVSRTMAVKPARKWTIHVVPQAHVDVGYTDLQEKAMDVHRKSNDLAVELVAKHPDFVWSVESSYVLNDWLKTRPQRLIQHFFELSRNNRIEIGAIYGNLLTGLLSDEEAFRSLYFSKKLQDTYGSDFRSATLTDAPSHIWSMPTVLRTSGVKYLSMGINQTRAPVLREGLQERSPVWWEGPDGSRILAYFHDHYAGAGRIGLTDAWPGQYESDPGLGAAESKIPWLISQYDRPDYPYDSIHIHGAYGDNRPLTPDLPRNVELWNAKYAYPKIVFTTNSEWFSMIEKKYGRRIGTVRGDGGAFWEDGAGSSALETAVNRQSQQQALLAEMLLAGFHAQGKIKGDHQPEFMDIWHDIMLYDEHTWGAHNSIAQPELPEVKEQYRYKAEFAYRAQRNLKPLLEKARRHVKKRPAARPKVSLDGSILHTPDYDVHFDVHNGGISSIIDRGTGRELLDTDAPFLCGQVVYAENEKPPYELSTSTYRGLYATQDGAQMWLEHPMLPQIKMTVRAVSGHKKLEFQYDIEKVVTYRKEGVYIAFPFAGKDPTIDYAVANAVVRAGRDWLPGSCKDWFTLQNWMRVRHDGHDTLWVTQDAPLINLQDINSNKWLRELPIENGHIYAYVMNNYWFTNYKAGQGGSVSFRFALTSGNEVSNAEAVQFGRDWSDAERAAIESMVNVGPANVIVSGFKRSEDGEGYIVRLREMSGQSTMANLRVPALRKLSGAHRANGVEVVEAELPVKDGAIPVQLGAWDVATVKVR